MAIPHEIGIRVVNGKGLFYDVLTTKNFVPRGNNYIRLAGTCDGQPPGPMYHSTFNPGLYNSTDVESSLELMSHQGYNMVRIFLNPGCMTDLGWTIDPAYLQNLADFLSRAKSNNLFVLITYDGPPQSCANQFRYYPNIDYQNMPFLTKEGVSAEVCFWQGVIRGLRGFGAPLQNILAYELRSEAQYAADLLPLNLTSSSVTTANGRTYDMSNAIAKQRMMEESLVYWINHVRQGVLEVDPTALITIGFFPPECCPDRPIRTGLVFANPESGGSTADFIDVHPYLTTTGTLSEQMASYDIGNSTRKPILVGEFGAYKSAYSGTFGFGYYASASEAGKALEDWQIGTCGYGAVGWSLWTWDSISQPGWWNALDAGGTINRFLSPQARPDPCMPLPA